MALSPRRRIYVISDLHLGGAPDPNAKQRGFRIFTHTAKLESFLDSLARRPKDGGQIELVINGDFVDFLAEIDPETRGWTPLKSPVQAESLLQLIASPEREGSIFDALQRYLHNGHRLTLLLGNHDVELSFPTVRRALERRLGVDGRQDFCFLYDGEAYVIGDVLIEHGNRYDPFNTNDYDALRRVRSLQTRREEVPENLRLRANPGSGLVASTLNPLKIDYPFLDLLKPEGEAVPPVLLALEPSNRRILTDFCKAASEARGHGMRKPLVPQHAGDIAALRPADPLAALLEKLLGPKGARDFWQALADSRGRVDDRSDQDISTGLWATLDRAVGLLRLLLEYDSPNLRKRLPALLQALRVLQGSRHFEVATGTMVPRRNADRVGRSRFENTPWRRRLPERPLGRSCRSAGYPGTI